MLILFDIDGTLTRSTLLDARLFAQAFAAVCGAPLPTTDWARYRHATDRGVAEEAMVALGQEPGALLALERQLVALFDQAFLRAPLEAVNGAPAMLRRLQSLGHRLALATGCFTAIGRRKLRASGIEADDLPCFGCDQEPAREAILSAAAQLAAPGERVVAVGDAAWDVRAAARLGLPFVGIDATSRLQSLGAGAVVPDYRDLDRFVAALATAPVPPLPRPDDMAR